MAAAAQAPSLRACPACGVAHSKWAFSVGGFPYVRCATCQTLYVAPLPDDSVVAGTYLDPDYQPSVATEAARMRAEAEPRAQQLYDQGVRRLVEIGCGAGFFLDACRDVGIEVEGIDPAPTAKLAMDKGHRIHAIWLEEHAPTRSYDAVALWEVIEHLPDPTATLARLHDWSKPGGILAISTPSMSGLPARVLGRRFPMVTPPDHLSLFTRAGLEVLLARCGFRAQRWTSFSRLDPATLERGFARYLTGGSGRLASALARIAHRPMQWADRAGLGTSFELYATAVETGRRDPQTE